MPQLQAFRFFKAFFLFGKAGRFSPYARISSRSCSKFCVRIVFNGLPADDGCFQSWEPMPICRNRKQGKRGTKRAVKADAKTPLVGSNGVNCTERLSMLQLTFHYIQYNKNPHHHANQFLGKYRPVLQKQLASFVRQCSYM